MKRVIIAMSGGVDSSVSAALLKKAGFDVIGVFIKFWSDDPSSEKRAKAVAKKINIPFKVISFKKEFKKIVVDYFIEAYKEGLTPNPCVVCNKEIKFGLLFKKLEFLKYDYIATGHYARIKNGNLLRGRDREKDQSYFLWGLNYKILDKVLFPVGGYVKSEVKKMAKDFKLPVVNIKESQEACFITTNLNDFLKKYIKNKSGDIICDGKVIGEHNGLFFYTIGQRKGINLPNGPFYVLNKDIKGNNLIVTKNEKDLLKKELFVKDVNWINKPKSSLKMKAKIRYKHNLAEAVISGKKVVFSKPQRAITSGQSIVFYSKEEVLGGGIIE
jgi:tRNA-specific 2-thiouridylase